MTRQRGDSWSHASNVRRWSHLTPNGERDPPPKPLFHRGSPRVTLKTPLLEVNMFFCSITISLYLFEGWYYTCRFIQLKCLYFCSYMFAECKVGLRFCYLTSTLKLQYD